MPPKRSHTPKADEAVNESNLVNNANTSNNDTESLPLKKQKVDEPVPQTNNKNQDTPSQASQDSSNNDDSDLPVCVYGAKCYRKNPQHFKEYRHPKGPGDEPASKTPQISPSKSDFSEYNNNNNNQKNHNDNNMTKKSSDYSPPPKAQNNSPSLEAYRGILEFALSKHKISADDKRSLREYRRKNGISDNDHFVVLKQLGWTEDEYDDGEKKIDDDIDLHEEKEVYEKPDGFKIITIRKEDANKSKERLHTFSKVCTKFYETMSKSQANYTVTEVGVIVNSKLFHKYRAKKLKLTQKLGGEVKEDWGFHGTTRDSIEKIANTNFLHPDDLKKLNLAATKDDKKKGKKKPAKAKPIELLDDGYFGKGIYFTKFADYALWYSEERESDQVLLSKLIVGNAYQCHKRMDGKGLQPGYDCHISPKGNEIVIFDTDQILPRYIITYVEKPAEEREQES